MNNNLQCLEAERLRLLSLVHKYGINNNKTIKQSEILDRLIVDYQKSQINQHQFRPEMLD